MMAFRASDRLRMLARCSFWPVAAGTALLAGGVYGASVVAEARANAALPPTPPGAPNVLLITLDTVRAQNLSLHGYERPTSPQLERLARRGVCFDRAISTISWTLPSHASLFTGHFPQEIFHDLPHIFVLAAESPMDDRFPTLAEFLDRQGYRTSAFVANSIFCDRVYGLDRGFVHYDDYKLDAQQIAKCAHLTHTLAGFVATAVRERMMLARKSGADVNREFLRWLDRAGGRPFFAFLNYMDAHDPYDPPPAFAGRFHSEKVPPGATGPHAEEAASLRDDYDCCLASLDHDMGLLFDELDRRGILDHTLVVLTSDHGEHLGEHGRFRHGDTLYMPVIHVPLLVMYPGKVPAGKRVAAPASLRDVPATIVDLLGCSANAPFPGASLHRFWEGGRPEPAYSNLDMTALNNKTVRLRSLVDERYHYIEAIGTPVRHLFDVRSDPTEEHDLAGTPDGKPIAQRAHDYIQKHFAAGKPPSGWRAPAHEEEP